MLTGWEDRETGISAYQRALRVKGKGLTMTELMVVVSILVLLMTALFFSLTTSEYSISVSSAKTDLQAQVRRIMEWVVKDTRQTNLIQINTNAPSQDHIKFKEVTGIDNDTGNYALSPNYIEYNYDSALKRLTRNEVNESGTVLNSWAFDNITQPPFYTDVGVPLAAGGILSSRKLIIVIAGRNLVRNSLVLNFSLTEEVRIRNE